MAAFLPITPLPPRHTHRSARTQTRPPHLHTRASLPTDKPSIPQPAIRDPNEPPLAPQQEDSNVTNLRQEHLVAYYNSTDTKYQPFLRPPPILALQNFAVELGELLTSFRRLVGLDPPMKFTPPDCLNLTLSNEAVANRERERMFENGADDVIEQASWFVRNVYIISCQLLDLKFEGRPIPRFWVLETVARMPYFAYSSCLHLLATIGWFRSPTLMNMHHAEELNEAYHLAVMESLGGDKRWGDRFLAFHASLAYYWALVILYLISPAEAYRFSELIESHASDTYAEFLDANEDVLRTLPVPAVAHEYYNNFLYYFYEFQQTKEKGPMEGNGTVQRPQIDSLYDVFQNILADEREHTGTMKACVDYALNGDAIWYNGKSVSASARRPRTIPDGKRQEFWRKWQNVEGGEEERK